MWRLSTSSCVYLDVESVGLRQLLLVAGVVEADASPAGAPEAGSVAVQR